MLRMKSMPKDLSADLGRLPLRENESQKAEGSTTLGTLPKKSERKRDQIVLKLNSRAEWQQRRLILTHHKLLILHVGKDSISDQIPLEQVTNILKIHDNQEPSAGKSSRIGLISSQNALTKADSASKGATLQTHGFNILTSEHGYNCGRIYSFRVAAEEIECIGWIKDLNASIKTAANFTMIKNFQLRVKKITHAYYFQQAFALLIGLNYISDIFQAQLMPNSGSDQDHFFNTMDIFFTSLFTVELSLNITANWFIEFFTDGWCIFDFVVVTVSLVSLNMDNMPGLSFLRLMRVFRVLRIFARLRSLRIIVYSLTASIFPVLNAFLVMTLVTTVYAILGVLFYAEGNAAIFGNFSQSLLTMFKVTTFDQWSDILAEMQAVQGDTGPILFLVSFIVIVCWVLLPVVVAVLLDNFVAASREEKMKAAVEDEKKRVKKEGIPLKDLEDPLNPFLESLMDCANLEDLIKEIEAVYTVLDADQNGSISLSEMSMGFRKLNCNPPIYLSLDDCDQLTNGGQLCNSIMEVGPESFEIMVRTELKRHIEKKLAKVISANPSDGFERAAIAALKAIMLFGDLKTGKSSPNVENGNVKRPSHTLHCKVHKSNDNDTSKGMNPLWEHLAKFSSPVGFENMPGKTLSDAGLFQGELSARVDEIFLAVAAERASVIEFSQLREGLMKMPFQPTIELCESEFKRISKSGYLCDKDMRIDIHRFHLIVRSGLEQYISSIICFASDQLANATRRLKMLQTMPIEGATDAVREIHAYSACCAVNGPVDSNQLPSIEGHCVFGVFGDPSHHVPSVHREVEASVTNHFQADVKNTKLREGKSHTFSERQKRSPEDADRVNTSRAPPLSCTEAPGRGAECAESNEHDEFAAHEPPNRNCIPSLMSQDGKDTLVQISKTASRRAHNCTRADITVGGCSGNGNAASPAQETPLTARFLMTRIGPQVRVSCEGHLDATQVQTDRDAMLENCASARAVAGIQVQSDPWLEPDAHHDRDARIQAKGETDAKIESCRAPVYVTPQATSADIEC